MREISPVPEVWVHPSDAEKYGIEDSDWIWLESLRGKIRGQAVVTEGIKPGTVCMERFWNPETLDKPSRGWKEMNVTVLTKATAPYNDVVGTYTLRAFLVKIYKAEGPPEGVWTSPEDFKSWLPAPGGLTQEVEED
jgi:anaerobic selenocysteine-containing dehydrogenase